MRQKFNITTENILEDAIIQMIIGYTAMQKTNHGGKYERKD